MPLGPDILLLNQRQELSCEQMTKALELIFAGKVPVEQSRAFLIALHHKGESSIEILASVRYLRTQAITISIDRPYLLDCCGTGGDSKNTFNISTAVAFVLAGAGCTVAKHGNRAVSSACGSADVLEALGVSLHLTPELSKRCIEDVGIGFLFAPDFHPILAKVSAIRRSIPHRTIFNILGPLLNPAGVKQQLVGVYEKRLTALVAEGLCELGSTSVVAVHADDGTDEISLSSNTNISRLHNKCITHFVFDPRLSGYSYCKPQDCIGGDAKTNAQRLIHVLKGHSEPLDHLVHINAAWGMIAAQKTNDFMEGLLMAQESITSGAAFAKLENLIHFTKTHSRN